ncbi:MAG: 30S ribosome-binding factor RbfA [Gammaproteobacteria bacterium]|nr:30S ribosome-binding factor RbfA [Gammaproteobacteria bacterium]
MPREYNRAERVAELIRRAVAPIMGELGRGRCGGLLSVTAVTVSPDLKNATVFVSCLRPLDDPRALIRDLMHHAGAIRQRVAHATALRFVPAITIRYDSSLADADRMNQLLDSLP